MKTISINDSVTNFNKNNEIESDDNSNDPTHWNVLKMGSDLLDAMFKTLPNSVTFKFAINEIESLMQVNEKSDKKKDNVK